MTTATARPIVTPTREGYVPLPAHERNADGVCIFCAETPIWATYAEYLAHFFAFEYEGEPGHEPDDEDAWTYFATTCLAVEYTAQDFLRDRHWGVNRGEPINCGECEGETLDWLRERGGNVSYRQAHKRDAHARHLAKLGLVYTA